ncbi:MAG: hypothetical protein Q9P14_03945 [candidate division KSB1 bacterium]|nr:hypothetical protein [candidate division KSB1 bacterium]
MVQLELDSRSETDHSRISELDVIFICVPNLFTDTKNRMYLYIRDSVQ